MHCALLLQRALRSKTNFQTICSIRCKTLIQLANFDDFIELDGYLTHYVAYQANMRNLEQKHVVVVALEFAITIYFQKDI